MMEPQVTWRAICRSWGLGLAALALLAPDARGQAPDRPNILFCISDDQSYPHASAYGEPVISALAGSVQFRTSAR